MLIRRIIWILAISTFFIFVTVIILGWYWGIFAEVSVVQKHMDRKILITQGRLTTYPKVAVQIAAVGRALADENRECRTAAAMLFDNPIDHALGEVRAVGGCLVSTVSAEDSSLYTTLVVDSGAVCVASMRAHSQIAPYKLYPAISEWMFKYQYAADSERNIIERYDSSGWIEVQFPVQSISETN